MNGRKPKRLWHRKKLKRQIKLISFEELRLKGINYTRQHIYKKIADGTFPPQVELGQHRVAFVEEDIDNYIEQCVGDRNDDAA